MPPPPHISFPFEIGFNFFPQEMNTVGIQLMVLMEYYVIFSSHSFEQIIVLNRVHAGNMGLQVIWDA